MATPFLRSILVQALLLLLLRSAAAQSKDVAIQIVDAGEPESGFSMQPVFWLNDQTLITSRFQPGPHNYGFYSVNVRSKSCQHIADCEQGIRGQVPDLSIDLKRSIALVDAGIAEQKTNFRITELSSGKNQLLRSPLDMHSAGVYWLPARKCWVVGGRAFNNRGVIVEVGNVSKDTLISYDLNLPDRFVMPLGVFPNGDIVVETSDIATATVYDVFRLHFDNGSYKVKRIVVHLPTDQKKCPNISCMSPDGRTLTLAYEHHGKHPPLLFPRPNGGEPEDSPPWYDLYAYDMTRGISVKIGSIPWYTITEGFSDLMLRWTPSSRYLSFYVPYCARIYRIDMAKFRKRIEFQAKRAARKLQ